MPSLRRGRTGIPLKQVGKKAGPCDVSPEPGLMFLILKTIQVREVCCMHIISKVRVSPKSTHNHFICRYTQAQDIVGAPLGVYP